MADLIERIERAEGPDRELDALIAAHLRLGAEQWPWAENFPDWEGRADGRVYLEPGGASFKAPAYTASLDAAMTLAEPAMLSELMHAAWAKVSRDHALHMRFWKPEQDGDYTARFALAFCAVALRAHEVRNKETSSG